ncbi:MAG: DoxX family protein [Spirosomataceae bacterium]
MKIEYSYWFKTAEAVGLLLVIIGLLQYSQEFSQLQWQAANDPQLILSLGAGLLALSLLLAYLWHKYVKNPELHYWIQTIIAFYVAHMIATYGAAKLLKTQFQAPHYILDTPIGELNGFWLTWAYFGYSETFAMILGSMQVAGCLLLVFRRTRLLATFILLPIMINIDLIDHFYNISPLAYFNALHYTFLLIFLLLLDFEKLKETFFSYRDSLSIHWKSTVLMLLRVLVIGGAFLHIYSLKSNFQEPTAVNGVWKVEEIKKNNQPIAPNMPDQDSLWSKIYFEWRYGFLLKKNTDRFDDKKDLYGQYDVDEKKKIIKLRFSKSNESGSDSLGWNYQLKDSTLIIQGAYRKDTLWMRLKKM